MLIRYECPRVRPYGADAFLDTDTRLATGYWENGTIRYGPKHVNTDLEEDRVVRHVWVRLDLQLPEGF